MHGFLVWGLFVVLLVLMIALGAGAALGSAAGILGSAAGNISPGRSDKGRLGHRVCVDDRAG